MADRDDQPEQHAMGLVMPFVVAKSNGGTLDDLSFACGWDCGALYGELDACHRLGAAPAGRWVKPEILPQLDLIAMEHGFVPRLGEVEHGYRWVSFTAVDAHAAEMGR